MFNDDYDAIIGLAYPELSDFGTPFFGAIMNSGILDQNIFSFYISANQVDKSELWFGEYDSSKFTGDIQWHPVVDAGKPYWAL